MTTKSKPRSRLTLTEKTLIKQQQANFIEKINTATSNEHQQAIFEAAASGQGRYVVLAGPGCGKTFTSIKASLSFTGKSIYFSYNNKIMLDTNFKLVAIDSKMVATTAHAFGLQCLQAFTRGKCQVDEQEEKYPLLLRQYLFDQWETFCAGIQAQAEEEDLDLGLLRSDALRWSENEGSDGQTLDDLVSDASLPVAHPDDTVAMVTDLMIDRDVGRVPVVARDSGRLVGLIARKDLLRLRSMRAIEEEERRAYLRPRPMAG